MIFPASILSAHNSDETAAGNQDPHPLGSVVLVRMSAIGDTILAARTHRWARERGYAPYLLTTATHSTLVQCMPQLAGACLVADLGLTFLLRKQQNAALEEVDEVTFFASFKAKKPARSDDRETVHIVDLQSTRRSRRAIHEFEKRLNQNQISNRSHKVRKLTLWRLVLVVWSFLARKQWAGRTPPRWLSTRLKPVHQLQKDVLEQLPNLNADERAPSISGTVLRAPRLTQKLDDDLRSSAPEFIVMLLGTSFRLKSWPPESFRRLIELILEQTKLNVVLCGGPDDRTTADYLSFREPERIINLVGRTSLAETLSWMGHARYVVTGDSFASHAADLMGIPASILFGATHPLLGFAPEGAHASVHHAGLSCSPCSRHGQGECRFKNIRCLTSIKPEEVFLKIEHVLSQNGQTIDTPSPSH